MRFSWDIAILLLLLGASFLLRWPYRDVPLIRDEGEYAYIGQEILRGATPYRDVYNQKTPLVFYYFALIESACGNSLTAVRVATTFYGLVSACMVFALARSLFDRGAAVAATAAFLVMTFDQCGKVNTCTTEFYQMLWTSVGLLLWYRGRKRDSNAMLLLAGIAAGLSFLTKQPGAVLLVFYLADAVWNRFRNPSPAKGWTSVAREMGCAAAGCGVVVAAPIAWFAWKGALTPYLECTIWNNVAYVGERHTHTAIKLLNPLAIIHWDLGFWIMGTLTLLVLAWYGKDRVENGLWILLVGMGLTTWLTGSTYPHYFQPFIVPLCLASGRAVSWLVQHACERTLSTRARFGCAILALAPWVWPAMNLVSPLAPANDPELHAMLPEFIVAPEVARLLQSVTEPCERILIVGSEPEILFYSQRRSCTRLIITYPLLGPYPYSEGLRNEYLDDFRRCRPRYVVLCANRLSLTEWLDYYNTLMDPLVKILMKSYPRQMRIADPNTGKPIYLVFAPWEAESPLPEVD
jgi:4-amino-4-deoxy-L-arabinose transferase-like glycosyltransferase